MKKIVLSVLAIGAFAFTANAQTPDIKFGAKAGVNFSNLSKVDDSKMKVGFHVGALAEIFINEKFSVQPELLYSAQGANVSKYEGSKMKTGFHVGALAEIFINEKFSVQPELLYSTQGAKGGYTEEFGFGQYVNVDTKLSLDYITVPMMAKYYVMDGLSVQAGPQVAFLVKAEGEYTTMGKTETEDVKKELNGVEFGFNLGAGYELPMGLFFDARYNIGISNVDKKNDDYQIKAKNGVFQLSVGYKF